MVGSQLKMSRKVTIQIGRIHSKQYIIDLYRTQGVANKMPKMSLGVIIRLF